jgi:hypothetical protein
LRLPAGRQVDKTVIAVMGGGLVATPLGFKQSSICASVNNQVDLLFWFCSLSQVVTQFLFCFQSKVVCLKLVHKHIKLVSKIFGGGLQD